jgi:hypothetical protein
LGIPLLKFDGQETVMSKEDKIWGSLLKLIFTQNFEKDSVVLAAKMFNSRLDFQKIENQIQTALTCGIPIKNHGKDK